MPRTATTLAPALMLALSSVGAAAQPVFEDSFDAPGAVPPSLTLPTPTWSLTAGLASLAPDADPARGLFLDVRPVGAAPAMLAANAALSPRLYLLTFRAGPLADADATTPLRVRAGSATQLFMLAPGSPRVQHVVPFDVAPAGPATLSFEVTSGPGAAIDDVRVVAVPSVSGLQAALLGLLLIHPTAVRRRKARAAARRA